MIPPLSPIYVDPGIGIGPFESQANKRLVDFHVPLTGCLLKTVDCLFQQTHVILLARNDPTFRLFHVDLLIQIAVKERGLDIH